MRVVPPGLRTFPPPPFPMPEPSSSVTVSAETRARPLPGDLDRRRAFVRCWYAWSRCLHRGCCSASSSAWPEIVRLEGSAPRGGHPARRRDGDRPARCGARLPDRGVVRGAQRPQRAQPRHAAARPRHRRRRAAGVVHARAGGDRTGGARVDHRADPLRAPAARLPPRHRSDRLLAGRRLLADHRGLAGFLAWRYWQPKLFPAHDAAPEA